jgi:hypothetical protein
MASRSADQDIMGDTRRMIERKTEQRRWEYDELLSHDDRRGYQIELNERSSQGRQPQASVSPRGGWQTRMADGWLQRWIYTWWCQTSWHDDAPGGGKALTTNSYAGGRT